jgi:hypothetical protein
MEGGVRQFVLQGCAPRRRIVELAVKQQRILRFGHIRIVFMRCASSACRHYSTCWLCLGDYKRICKPGIAVTAHAMKGDREAFLQAA